MGFAKICKNVTVISLKNEAKQQRQAATFFANVIMATIASLPGVRFLHGFGYFG